MGCKKLFPPFLFKKIYFICIRGVFKTMDACGAVEGCIRCPLESKYASDTAWVIEALNPFAVGELAPNLYGKDKTQLSPLLATCVPDNAPTNCLYDHS